MSDPTPEDSADGCLMLMICGALSIAMFLGLWARIGFLYAGAIYVGGVALFLLSALVFG